ncbi:MAG: hypothetical protein AABX70_04240 [Nanoarchaeota archaeon]
MPCNFDQIIQHLVTIEQHLLKAKELVEQKEKVDIREDKEKFETASRAELAEANKESEHLRSDVRDPITNELLEKLLGLFRIRYLSIDYSSNNVAVVCDWFKNVCWKQVKELAEASK